MSLDGPKPFTKDQGPDSPETSQQRSIFIREAIFGEIDIQCI